jgi:hypothetical protein
LTRPISKRQRRCLTSLLRSRNRFWLLHPRWQWRSGCGTDR